jgi:hypothetical protein
MIDIRNIHYTNKHTTIYNSEAQIWTREQIRKQTKEDDTMIYLPKFKITNPVIPTSLLRKFELLTKINSKPGLFQPLSSIY